MVIGKSVTALLAIGVLTACTREKPVTDDPRPWTVLNMDCNYYENSYPDSMMNPEAIDKHVGERLQGPVTHFFVNPQGMIACYPSKVLETAWSRPPWLKDDPMKKDWVRRLKTMADRGIDRFQLFIDSARKRQVEGWISMRMNDVHGVDVKDSQQCVFWHEHPEFWREPNTDSKQWFLRAFDYSHREVREHHIRMIEELFDRYDMDGFDADWTRFPSHLTPGKEREQSACLTEVMRAVRRRANIEAKRRGHPVRVSATVLSSPEAALGAGMDAVTWAKEGLIDVLFVANFFSCVDFDTPYAEWVRLVRAANPHVRIVNRVDSFVQVYPGTELTLDGAGYRGYYDNLMAQGCRDFGFFNLFETASEKAKQVIGRGVRREEVLVLPRRYVVTYRDYVAQGTDARRYLPTKLDGGKCVPLFIGTISDAGNVVLEFALDRKPEGDFVPTLNGVKSVRPAVEAPELRWFENNKYYNKIPPPPGFRAEFPVSALRQGRNEIGFPATKGVTAYGAWILLVK